MRFSITMRDELYQDVQSLRGERIQKESKSLSLSSLISELVQRGLEALKEKKG